MFRRLVLTGLVVGATAVGLLGPAGAAPAAGPTGRPTATAGYTYVVMFQRKKSGRWEEYTRTPHYERALRVAGALQRIGYNTDVKRVRL